MIDVLSLDEANKYYDGSICSILCQPTFRENSGVTRRGEAGEAEYCQDTKISCRRDDGTTAALARLRQEVRRYYCEPMGAWREARRDASTMPTQTMLQIPVQPAEGLGLVGWSKTRKPQTPAPRGHPAPCWLQRARHTSSSEHGCVQKIPTIPYVLLASRTDPTDIYRALLDSIRQNYGLVAGASSELKVLLYDSEHRLAIVKTSRDHYPTVRTSLTFLTQIKQGGDAVKVAAATLSVCGSSRTARNAACAELQKTFVNSQRPLNDGESPKRRKTIEKGLNDLEQRMKHVDSCV
ncbi:hypothetical protein THAOC_05157 [Thalassiosira oceanica]|uniref:Uncharacterized protein n=1 Tax=Thalassiosira oceanica TaxID=159749 RepID=K0T3K1_THAOC|nr:hypothetical protein THAOC_05157 [Thalassiosira oceanica]|eukprot:EJK73228.1 hypothetical protein THAOC_05157 [Thalassiosira oceanica]